MIVTLNEVQRACQKALYGAGAPAGLDDDGAAAAAWLEVRGLPALAPLAAALERWDGDPRASRLEETAPGAFHAGGRSAVFLGPLLIDTAIAYADEEGHAALDIAALANPEFLVPLAHEAGRAGWSFALSWPGCGATVAAETGTTLLGDWRAPVQGPCEVTLRCWRAAAESSDLSLPVALGPAELEARCRETLAAGLDVAEPVWQTIGRYAQRALVPASAESRARGAGSAASDNE